jgi:hypothetical protein
MAYLPGNNIIKTNVPSHVSNSNSIIGSRPTGEQPGSGYTWGGGRTQQPIGNKGPALNMGNKPTSPALTPHAPGAPVGIGNYSGAKTMDTPMDKASHPDRMPNLPFNNKIPGA